MKNNLSHSRLRGIRMVTNPLFASLCGVLSAVTWYEGLYVATVLVVAYICLIQYSFFVMILEEKRRERVVVYNSLKRALVQYMEEADNGVE